MVDPTKKINAPDAQQGMTHAPEQRNELTPEQEEQYRNLQKEWFKESGQ